MNHPVPMTDHNGLDRRGFLKLTGSVTGAVLLSGAVSNPLLAQLGSHREPIPAITDPSVRALVFQGIQAARDSGAQYAEVRLTHDLIRDVEVGRVNDTETVYANVRASVNGRWGSASGPAWDKDTIVDLARRAALHASAQASAMGAGMDLGALPQREIIRDGHWHMPVRVDPLSVHPVVIQDFLQAFPDQVRDTFGRRANAQTRVRIGAKFFVQERAFGTSDDSYCTQRVYLTSGALVGSLTVRRANGATASGGRIIHLTDAASQGWELFTEQPLCEAVINSFPDIEADTSLPIKPVTPGMSALILDAVTVARITSQTIGAASELDRALGHEADGGGISYLNNPAGMLDRFTLGSSMLTVTANRSEPGGAATVQWDDEGVAPQPFTIVKDGVFHNYHLSREGVAWLKQENVSGREQAHGVVSALQASNKPYIQTANLALKPADTQADITEVMYQAQDGILFEEAAANMNGSKLHGIITGGRAYEIKDGKKIARIANATAIINATNLWNSLYLLGGPNSQLRTALVATKGEPQQQSFHSVTAVPAAFREQSITDINLR